MLVKTRVLTRDTLETVSRFVMKLAMPVMIFTNTVDGVDRSSLLSSLSLLGLTALLYACTFVMARLMAAAFRLQGDRAQVYRALTMFGNVGFMGIPIVSSIFPDYACSTSPSSPSSTRWCSGRWASSSPPRRQGFL